MLENSTWILGTTMSESDWASSLVAVSLFLTEKVDMCGYHAWRMCPCLHDDTAWLCRGGEIEKHHSLTGRPVPSSCFFWCWKSEHAEEKQGVLLDEIVDGLCKLSYHRFVGAAFLLLANVFHCADCVDNRIINDIPCVKRKELGDGISKWVSHLYNKLDKVHCRLSSG